MKERSRSGLSEKRIVQNITPIGEERISRASQVSTFLDTTSSCWKRRKGRGSYLHRWMVDPSYNSLLRRYRWIGRFEQDVDTPCFPRHNSTGPSWPLRRWVSAYVRACVYNVCSLSLSLFLWAKESTCVVAMKRRKDGMGNEVQKRRGTRSVPRDIRHIARKKDWFPTISLCTLERKKERIQLFSMRNDDGLRKTTRPKRAVERPTGPDYRPNATELRRARFCGGRATSRVTDH